MASNYFYALHTRDFRRVNERAEEITAHVWHVLDDGDRRESLYGVRIPPQEAHPDPSQHWVWFSLTPSGILMVACDCTSGEFRKQCIHIPLALEFHIWRVETQDIYDEERHVERAPVRRGGGGGRRRTDNWGDESNHRRR